MRHRDVILAVIAAVSSCTATGALALTSYYTTGAAMPYGAVPAIAATTLLLWALTCWPRSRSRLARPVALAGVLSLITTAVSTPPAASWGSSWRLAEMALLLALLTIVFRFAPLRQAITAGVVAGTSVATWTLPLIPGASVLSLAGAAALWSLPVLGVAVVGGYPRLMEQRRRQLVTETRRSQQLELARDLHDFVAHDVSGIVAQAQAARFVAASDPGQAVPALERIEKAGLNALASMDRMVRMLHEADGDDIDHPTEPLPGVDQLPTLIKRFSSAGTTEARLTMPPDVTDALSRETGSTAYRTVVEALTNVRRHAPGAARVDVTLTRARTAASGTPTLTPTIEIQIVNDAGTPPTTATATTFRGKRERDGHGGRGLNALRERVRATGGTLSYGPYDGGWRVLAVLPQTPTLTQEAP
ncbi:sensor histidine kinase [Streptomyces inhibens]|uniref:sensor histidine kinase n=1 Tax=Streptomyces inhibens TaxID=2293571 RepID=UPI0037AE90E8